MEFVDDLRELLRTMEANQIGTKHPLHNQAYALYYEKDKKFEEAEKNYISECRSGPYKVATGCKWFFDSF